MKAKVYTVETRKRSYSVVGTSIKDIKTYIEDNKNDLDLSFDMSGYYKVILDKFNDVSSYTIYDKGLESEYIDLVYLNQGNCQFCTSLASYELYENNKHLIKENN